MRMPWNGNELRALRAITATATPLLLATSTCASLIVQICSAVMVMMNSTGIGAKMGGNGGLESWEHSRLCAGGRVRDRCGFLALDFLQSPNI